MGGEFRDRGDTHFLDGRARFWPLEAAGTAGCGGAGLGAQLLRRLRHEDALLFPPVEEKTEAQSQGN